MTIRDLLNAWDVVCRSSTLVDFSTSMCFLSTLRSCIGDAVEYRVPGMSSHTLGYPSICVLSSLGGAPAQVGETQPRGTTRDSQLLADAAHLSAGERSTWSPEDISRHLGRVRVPRLEVHVQALPNIKLRMLNFVLNLSLFDSPTGTTPGDESREQRSHSRFPPRNAGRSGAFARFNSSWLMSRVHCFLFRQSRIFHFTCGFLRDARMLPFPVSDLCIHAWCDAHDVGSNLRGGSL